MYVVRWPITSAASVVRTWQIWAPTADRNLSSKLTFHTHDIEAVGLFFSDGSQAVARNPMLADALSTSSIRIPTHPNCTHYHLKQQQRPQTY